MNNQERNRTEDNSKKYDVIQRKMRLKIKNPVHWILGEKLRKHQKGDLIKSIRNSDSDIIKSLVNSGEVDVNDTCEEWSGGTVLHAATLVDNLDFVECLIDLGADVRATTTKYLDTPLHNAAQSGNVDIIRCLMRNGANINAKDWIEWTSLHCAVWANKIDAIRSLVEEFHADIDAKNRNLETPLRLAFKANNHKIIKYLLSYGADIEARDSEDQTALHWAARHGKINTLHFLVVKHSVNIESKDCYGRTPLRVAVDFEKYDCVWALMQLGAEIGEDIDKNDLVIRAAKMGHSGAIRRLVAQGVSLDFDDPMAQRSPLHWAIKEGELEVIVTLLEHGAKIDSLDRYQKTPLEWAMLYNDKPAISLLSSWNEAFKGTTNPALTTAENEDKPDSDKEN